MSAALVEHRAAVAGTRDDRACYRKNCAAPGMVRFFDRELFLTTACAIHGREMWPTIGGANAEANGAFIWWSLSPAPGVR